MSILKREQLSVRHQQEVNQQTNIKKECGRNIVAKGDRRDWVWYLKWASSITIIIGIMLTSNNVFPYNLFVSSLGLLGWTVVALTWNDRSLIVINIVSFVIYMNGILQFMVEK